MIHQSKSPGGELIHFGRFGGDYIEDTDAAVLAVVQEIADFLKPYAGMMIFMRKPLTIIRGQKSFEKDKTFAQVLIRGTILLGEADSDLEIIPWQQNTVSLLDE